VTLRAFVGVAALAALCVGTFDIYAQYRSVSPEGSTDALWLSPLLVAPIGLAMLTACLGGVLLLPFRRARGAATKGLAAGATGLAVLVICGYLGHFFRVRGLAGLAERSAKVVAAIERYERQEGRPPDALSDLVPFYLEAIPETGIAAYPAYEYEHGERARSTYGDRWSLAVPMTAGSFDVFYYVPSRIYPSRGSVDRVGDWAYVHE
jgi:hypothetical protein